MTEKFAICPLKGSFEWSRLLGEAVEAFLAEAQSEATTYTADDAMPELTRHLFHSIDTIGGIRNSVDAQNRLHYLMNLLQIGLHQGLRDSLRPHGPPPAITVEDASKNISGEPMDQDPGEGEKVGQAAADDKPKTLVTRNYLNRSPRLKKSDAGTKATSLDEASKPQAKDLSAASKPTFTVPVMGEHWA